MSNIFINTGTINGNVSQNEAQRERFENVSSRTASEQAGYDYDVAISYASRQTRFVSRVAKILRLEGLRVFFAPDCEEEFIAQNMVEKFYTIYRYRCLYVASFISAEYLESDICMEEISSALLRTRDEGRNCLIPICMEKESLKDLLEKQKHPIPLLDPDVNYIAVYGKNGMLKEVEFADKNRRVVQKQIREK